MSDELNIEEALDTFITGSKQALDDFVNTMCPIELSEGQIIKHEPGETIEEKYDVISTVGFAGQCSGTLSIHMPRPFAEHVTKTLLMLDEIDEPSDVTDTAAEMGNIVCGGARTILASESLVFEITCPTVTAGKGLIVRPIKGSRNASLHYDCGDLKFMIMISLREA